MSDANRERLTYKTETAWADYGTGTLKEIPHAGLTGGQDAAFFESRIVRSDREIQDIVRGSFSARMDISYELLYRGVSTAKNGLDDFLQFALFSGAWSTPATTVIGCDTTATTVDKASAFGSGWAVGDIVKVTTGVGGGSPVTTYQVVTGQSANSLTVSPGGLAVTTGTTTIVEGSYIQNGTTTSSFTAERNFLDVTQKVLYPGCMIDSMSLSIAVNGPVSGTFGVLAKLEDQTTASMGTPTSANQASTNRVFDSVGHVVSTRLGSSLGALSFMDFSLNIANNLAPREVVGVSGVESMRVGSQLVTGSFNSYFSTNSQLSDYLTNTASSIFIAMQDSLGNGYAIWIPSVILTAGRRNGGGKDTDVRAEVQWRARKSSTYDHTIRIARFDA